MVRQPASLLGSLEQDCVVETFATALKVLAEPGKDSALSGLDCVNNVQGYMIWDYLALDSASTLKA